MKALILVLATAIALQAQSRGPATAGTATLSGRVVRADGTAKAPVARVQVSLGPGDSSGNRIAVTDDQGRFEFSGLPAGGYLLAASRPGWVTSYYGSPRPGRPPGVRIVVADGEKATVEVPMVPGSVIGGRMIDENGQPMARQFPWLLEQRLVGNRQMLARMRLPYGIGYFERQTNDLGEFRLFGLPPGTYHLVVNPSISASTRMTTQEELRWALQPPGTAFGAPPPQGAMAGYASMYFPGTADPAGSQAIVVGPGEVRDGLTFRIGFVPVTRIEGAIRTTDGSPVPDVRVTLEPRVPQVVMEGATRLANSSATGQFSFSGVPPGDYKLTARSAPRPGVESGTAPMLWGETNVVVSGQDTVSAPLALAPASSMTGRLSFAVTSMTPPADLAGVRLQFVATGAQANAIAGGGTISAATYSGTVAANGTFRVAGLPPDRYNVSATWPGMRNVDGAGWWLTSISVGGKDIGDSPIDVPANREVTDVTLGFRDRIGSIEGLLTDAEGKPMPQYFVLAFPQERPSWTTTSRKAVPAVRPGTDGRFRVNGLLPGQYYLAVVTVVDAEEIMDPTFLEAILPSAVKVAIGDGQTVRQDLKIGR